MILNNFSKEEILENAAKVIGEFSLSSIPYGLTQKYKKQLANRKIGDNSILGVHKYHIHNNTVYVVANKRLYNYSARRTGEIVFTYYISCRNSNTGKYSYVMPTFDVHGHTITGYVMYTAHFVQRLRERDGKEFQDLLKEVGGDSMALAYKGDDGQFETTWGTYRLFGKQEGPFAYITTMVTDDMLFDNQIPTGEEIQEMMEEHNKYKCETLTV